MIGDGPTSNEVGVHHHHISHILMYTYKACPAACLEAVIHPNRVVFGARDVSKMEEKKKKKFPIARPNRTNPEERKESKEEKTITI